MAVGLRERRKEATREAIAEAAMLLFDKRGFDAVAVSEIAEKARVSTKTVFNYFAVKEDLVLSSRHQHELALLDALAERPAGRPAVEVARDCALSVLEDLNRLPDGRRARFHRVISAAPSIVRRLRSRSSETETRIAELLAAQTAATLGDPRPALAASILMSLWHLAFAPAVGDQSAADRIVVAAELLANGLGSYAT